MRQIRLVESAQLSTSWNPGDHRYLERERTSASSVFAIALSAGAADSPLLGGYLVVWAICAATALAAGAALFANVRGERRLALCGAG